MLCSFLGKNCSKILNLFINFIFIYFICRIKFATKYRIIEEDNFIERNYYVLITYFYIIYLQNYVLSIIFVILLWLIQVWVLLKTRQSKMIDLHFLFKFLRHLTWFILLISRRILFPFSRIKSYALIDLRQPIHYPRTMYETYAITYLQFIKLFPNLKSCAHVVQRRDGMSNGSQTDNGKCLVNRKRAKIPARILVITSHYAHVN